MAEAQVDFSAQLEATQIMGILNITPDSFSDGGRYNQIDLAVKRAGEMIAAGADIIDIGGESTRPGAEKVSKEEELERVIPVIEALVQEVDVPLSIDTYKAEVAERALQAGASIINDVWGAKADVNMAKVAAQNGATIVLMHNRLDRDYGNFIEDVKTDLRESISLCKKAGVTDEQIILDPGVGFVKSYEQNLEVIRRLDEIAQMGYPVLLGVSRKSFISKALDLPVEDRLEGTGAANCLGISKGAGIIRVHDVKEMSRMAKMMDALLGKGQ
ncbi:dihydropteroate synthase [Alkalicoccobacillus plakortidis]|uniref:Dihydropteroate synthase n=1 Tax=Alkalicoccobacillus plakortidis TaxID=444060 RepID=A0ABT0XR27_9BACI|nr:dihydropteroate synthase [Alkalicoccobacillus plakortidis]MCM2677714.1 dihydropteroate synthase [Alkalicoccobacillus plakortidis]